MPPASQETPPAPILLHNNAYVADGHEERAAQLLQRVEEGSLPTSFWQSLELRIPLDKVRALRLQPRLSSRQ